MRQAQGTTVELVRQTQIFAGTLRVSEELSISQMLPVRQKGISPDSLVLLWGVHLISQQNVGRKLAGSLLQIPHTISSIISLLDPGFQNRDSSLASIRT